MHRGDILLLQNAFPGSQVNVVDIVVFSITGRDIPIVHRVIKKVPQNFREADVNGPIVNSSHWPEDEWLFLTKGDYNRFDDRGLYAEGQDWIPRKDIQGKVVGVLRYLGFATIILNDYPSVKYVLLAIMGWAEFTAGGND